MQNKWRTLWIREITADKGVQGTALLWETKSQRPSGGVGCFKRWYGLKMSVRFWSVTMSLPFSIDWKFCIVISFWPKNCLTSYVLKSRCKEGFKNIFVIHFYFDCIVAREDYLYNYWGSLCGYVAGFWGFSIPSWRMCILFHQNSWSILIHKIYLTNYVV